MGSRCLGIVVCGGYSVRELQSVGVAVCWGYIVWGLRSVGIVECEICGV